MPAPHTEHDHRRLAAVVSFVILSSLAMGVFVYRNVPALQRAGKILGYRISSTLTSPKAGPTTVRLAVKFHRQEHSLSCEVATLKMALDFLGSEVTERQLIDQLIVSDPGPRQPGNIWGDPDLGFVGDINGRIPNGGYGVYEAPIVDLANRYRTAKILTGQSLESILIDVANQHPVIVWGSLSSGRDISWTTPEGKRIKAVYGEHTRLLIGFVGTPAKPTRLILHDPIYGTITMTKEKFLANWKLLGNKAVVVY